MEWRKLLSSSRFENPSKSDEEQRSVFQRDYDRIVFCAAFRRLQDKTQVHPFPTSDYVRRRLTHSLEVSSVGRSLGYSIGTKLAMEDEPLASTFKYLAHDVAQIVSNACLAHDIGNPPFGHAGEQAIGSWFKAHRGQPILNSLDKHEVSDFEEFEGNAQGFRLLTRIQNSINDGGMKLTFATLGAFSKYPSASTDRFEQSNYIGSRKYGFFKEDMSHFSNIADDVGLKKKSDGSWCRHPLVFLVEAADDICYRIVDVEDALKLNRVTFDEAEECLLGLIPDASGYSREDDHDANIGWLRAKAIGCLIESAIEAWNENETSIMNGSFSKGLLEASKSDRGVGAAKKIVAERVFAWDRTIAAEISGVQMIIEVLDKCMKAIDNPDDYINGMVLKIIPRYDKGDSFFKKVHAVTDFVSGMTDSYLRTIYLRLSGHAVF